MQKVRLLFGSLIVSSMILGCQGGKDTESKNSDPDAPKIAQLKSKIKHIIVIYQENWSFDGLYGRFPGADNIDSAGNVVQVDKDGNVLDSVPAPMKNKYGHPWVKDTNFKMNKLVAKPYDLLQYIQPSTMTGEITHLFYTEQWQIDGGKMDKYAAYSQNPGLVLSHFDGTKLPVGQLASDYTLCDHFFHSAFGGSFLNHQWLIAARSPEWKNAPKGLICDLKSPDVEKYDNQVTTDGYVVNTSISINQPRPNWYSGEDSLVPYQTYPTIGDRLNDAKVSWGWFAGGWNDAVAGKANETFQYHHQPFLYFKSFENGSQNKKDHLKDEVDFFNSLQNGTLPSVSFIKPLGIDDEHPNYSNLEQGLKHVDSVVRLILNSKYADDCVIILTHDEHGGRWDHVSPPKIDKWGPGSRVPCIVVSKHAKKKFIDKTQYETVSILKLIETRFDLKPLGTRDSAARNMLNVFDF